VSTFLSIALLVIGAASTAAAFGGKTWIEGPEPFLKRITQRGWISLACLLLALFLGIGKQVQDRSDKTASDDIAAAQRAKDKAENETKQEILLAELTEADRKADIAATKLDDAERRLKDTKSTLVDLRENLRDTRSSLSEENAANLIAVLGNANRLIKDVKLFIPLATTPGRITGFNDAFTPDFGIKSCQDHTTVDVLVSIGIDSTEDLRYETDDKANRHKYYLEHPPKVDALLRLPDDDAVNVVAHNEENRVGAAGKASARYSGRYGYNLQIRTLANSVSAALLYKLLLNPGSVPFHVVASWPATTELYPRSCVGMMEKHFRSLFDRAALILVLDGGQNETIIFRYKAQPPILIPGERGKKFTQLAVDFKTYSTPVALAGLPSVEMASDWPGLTGSPSR
jgi:hypothetical protein